MGLPNRTINVRLPADLAAEFDALARSIPGLPRSVILRMLIAHCLSKPAEEQVEIVTRQILRPRQARKAAPSASGNTSRRF